MAARFGVGEILRNTNTGEDGKVDRVDESEFGEVKYTVHLPFDPYGWEMGTGATDIVWDEREVELSENDLLRR